jgi:hypothetical protein
MGESVIIWILGLVLYGIFLLGLDRINKTSKEIVQRLDLVLYEIRKGRGSNKSSL